MVSKRRYGARFAGAWILAKIGILASLLIWSAVDLQAGDWPQWRYDAARGAVSPDELPAELHLQWTRQLPPPRPAWPESQPWLRFDLSYAPVAAGKMLLAPSMVTDTVTAYDTETGAERWHFYTDGPVRFAPLVHDGRVYFGSDDGYLYCLDAADGSLSWKFRGGPSDRKVLGNERLISTWPVRGGPVLLDGKIYFTAGIWPFMGIFVHAVDAQTGKAVWTNSGYATTWTVQPHNSPAFGSLVPRGHLAATERGLVVPGGRTEPGCFDLTSGEFSGFSFGAKGAGSHHVTARRDWFFVTGTMRRIADGQTVLPTRAALHDEKAVYGIEGDQLFAQALETEKQKIEQVDRRGQKILVSKPRLRQLWKVALPEPVGRLFLKAGSRFYAGKEGQVVGIEVQPEEGKAKIAWKDAFEGSPWTMLAADERLFVVTVGGRIDCFGAAKVKPKTYATMATEPPQKQQEGDGPTKPDPWTRLADSVLKTTEAKEGYALLLGLGSPQLAERLIAASELHLIVIDPDAEKINALRRRMDEAGLYGTRIAAHVGDPATFPLPPYLARLIVAGDARASGIGRGAPFVEAVFRALRPYGGAACLPVEANKLAGLVEQAGLAKARVEAAGDRASLLVREGALPGAGDWTHQYADPANSVVSKDQRVKAPLGLLWFGGPPNDEVLPRHGHGPSPQVAGGRLFIEGRNMLRALDIYTGRLLWQRDLPDLGLFYDNTSHQPGAGEIGSNYVSLDDAVYAVYGGAILELDPATGQTRRQFKPEATTSDPRPNWGYLAACDDLLVATATPVAVPGSQAAARPAVPPGFNTLIKPHEQWQYLAGADPEGDWTAVDYPATRWKTGAAGFGYGDGDDRTILDMRNRYTRVYIRKRFDGGAAAGAAVMALAINYDDAFVAYLNGREVLRVGVGSGSGPKAAGIRSHEAEGFQPFAIRDFRKLLRPGRNVIAIEGHNTDADSSDFSLDPYLLIKPGSGSPPAKPKPKPKPPAIEDVLTPARYASASRRLVVLDRNTGQKLWEREAKYGFRHNNIAIGAGKLFAIDGLSKAKQDALGRRGIRLDDYAPRLVALDVRTGREIWSTSDDVFGTFLNYSEEHDVLLQAGSAFRDRALDESEAGMVAYRGRDGSVLWENLGLTHAGPCMLHHDTIITQGPAYSLLTGEPKIRKHPLTDEPLPWRFVRNYGCNTAIASEHLITFRSAAAGYYELAGDGGTGNLGGFKSSCTSNLIVAGGLLSAPEYTRTCECRYQNQTSLALVHDPDVEMWTFNALEWDGKPVRRVGINFGAPGDRRDGNGTLWLDYPSDGGPSPDLPVDLQIQSPHCVRHHSSQIRVLPGSGGLNWVAASGLEGAGKMVITLAKGVAGMPRDYTVRLHFAELRPVEPGGRVFNVRVQGMEALKQFDAAKEAGPMTALVKEFKGIKVLGQLEIVLTPEPGKASAPPLLCGLEIVAEGW